MNSRASDDDGAPASPASRTWRVIHMGVGGIGRLWAKYLFEDERVEIAALVDIDPAAMHRVCDARGYDPRICHESLDSALAVAHADIFVCTTPPAARRHAVTAAMRSGLDVISEKPMAQSIGDCHEILNCARETGRTLVVSQNYRNFPATSAMAGLVARGVLGEIGQVKIDFYRGHDFGGGFRHSMRFPQLVDMAIHHFDLLRYITGLEATFVSGESWNPPWSNYAGDSSSALVFELENGARATYNASWSAKGQFSDWIGNWQIEGSNGTIVYTQDQITMYEAPTGYAVEREYTVPPAEIEKPGQHGILDRFLGNLAADRVHDTDAEDNLRTMAMVFSAVDAVCSGARTPVPDRETAALLRSRAK